jgi:DNA-binding transcriptional MocR family regulator
MLRYADSSYLEYVRHKVEHNAAPSARQCEIQIEAILRRNRSVSLSQLCQLLKFDRTTIELALEQLAREGECVLEANTIRGTSQV